MHRVTTYAYGSDTVCTPDGSDNLNLKPNPVDAHLLPVFPRFWSSLKLSFT